ncbi:MAG: hypothetical protein FWB74_06085 [Defluviitaleaceae bacterium]|nr:hypothetical protein [Defluviitaleaceae bacterium]
MAMLLAMVMAFAFLTPMYAGDELVFGEIKGEVSLVEVDGSVFAIAEYVDDYYRITRTLQRTGRSLTPSRADANEGRRILVAMGMCEEMADMIPIEDLETIATSPFVTGTVVYVEETHEGVSRYVSAEYARIQAAYANTLLDANFMNVAPMNSGEYINSYIRVLHVVSRVAGNPRELLHASGAHWLSMPFNRGFGSLGVVTQQSNAIFGLSTGHFSYSFGSTIRSGTIPVTYHVAGSFAAPGITFRLPPRDQFEIFVTATDFRVTMGHRTEFINQTLPFSVASQATYTHRITGIGAPSLSIGLGGLGLGLGFTSFYRHYTAQVRINP